MGLQKQGSYILGQHLRMLDQITFGIPLKMYMFVSGANILIIIVKQNKNKQTPMNSTGTEYSFTYTLN